MQLPFLSCCCSSLFYLAIACNWRCPPAVVSNFNFKITSNIDDMKGEKLSEADVYCVMYQLLPLFYSLMHAGAAKVLQLELLATLNRPWKQLQDE